MKYKLLLLDIDGTIVSLNFKLSSRLKNAVREAQKRGILVTLTTGRMFKTSLPFVKELNITLPIICYQGALIKNPLNNELIYHEPVPVDLAKEVIKIAREEKTHLNLYLNDNLYITKPRIPEAFEYLKIEKQSSHTHLNYININHYELKESPTKLIIISNVKTLNKIERKCQRLFKGKLDTTRGFPKFLDILKLGVSKGNALKILRNYLKIEKKEVFSIGDYYNDISMFNESGFSVAVKNAPPKVKRAANFITDSVDQDGAAKAIERFLI